MKKIYPILLVMSFLACGNSNESSQNQFLELKVPDSNPLTFKSNLKPNESLIHRGIFHPNLEEYYYTLSDESFKKFDVYMIKKVNGKWSDPKEAFFNSNFNEHGMSFSPDGNSIYFSSTRPTNIDSIPITWHIWRSKKVNEKWSKPVYVDIPNMAQKLTSHPTITNSKKLYFHASNLDYSEMNIYHSQLIDGKFQAARKVNLEHEYKTGTCTPFISSNEEFLVFAAIGNQLDLYIAFNNNQDEWSKTVKLSENINTFGQGNPYVTPDDKFLFYATGENQKANWDVKWVEIESKLKK